MDISFFEDFANAMRDFAECLNRLFGVISNEISNKHSGDTYSKENPIRTPYKLSLYKSPDIIKPKLYQYRRK